MLLAYQIGVNVRGKREKGFPSFPGLLDADAQISPAGGLDTNSGVVLNEGPILQMLAPAVSPDCWCQYHERAISHF